MRSRSCCAVSFKAAALAAAVTAASAVQHASAHDLLPPMFRGGPGSTFQAWEFNGPLLGPPDGDCPANNPFGAPIALITGNPTWLPRFPANVPMQLEGIWCMQPGDGLHFVIPNIVDPNFLKTVWVQVVFHPHGGSSVNVDVSEPGGMVPFLAGMQDLPVPNHPAWIHRTWVYCFDSCPPLVNVDVTGSFPPGCLPPDCHVDVDQVIVDTFCAPFCVPPPLPMAPGDFDGDGIPDPSDNAPGVANPNQVDCDCDGFGNVSDLWGICRPGTPLENEPCGLVVNNGCDMVPPTFEPIACGDSVCGTAWADAGLRDTDWYEIDLPDSDGDGLAKLRVEICSSLPVVGIVYDNDCANLQVRAQTEANADLEGCLTVCLPAPATYWVFIGPGTLAGGPIFAGFPCGTVNEYELTVDCYEPCTAGGHCSCPWDMDDNGSVDVVDFLNLLAAWGYNPGSPADFNCDQFVDVIDFLDLLAHWGPCP